MESRDVIRASLKRLSSQVNRVVIELIEMVTVQRHGVIIVSPREYIVESK